MKSLLAFIALTAVTANASELSCPLEIKLKVGQLKEAQGLTLSNPIPAAKAANGNDVFLVKADREGLGAPTHIVYQVETRNIMNSCIVENITKLSDVE